jgi:hypothetical protein
MPGVVRPCTKWGAVPEAENVICGLAEEMVRHYGSTDDYEQVDEKLLTDAATPDQAAAAVRAANQSARETREKSKARRGGG